MPVEALLPVQVLVIHLATMLPLLQAAVAAVLPALARAPLLARALLLARVLLLTLLLLRAPLLALCWRGRCCWRCCWCCCCCRRGRCC